MAGAEPFAKEGLPEIYLQPGESRLVKEPAILRTLLGSCVGIAFRVPRLGMGALRDEVEVKIFGGGDVLVAVSDTARPTVGRLNCEMAMKVLEEEGFYVSASSLGGKRGVNIYFNTQTGEVLLQRHS